MSQYWFWTQAPTEMFDANVHKYLTLQDDISRKQGQCYSRAAGPGAARVFDDLTKQAFTLRLIRGQVCQINDLFSYVN